MSNFIDKNVTFNNIQDAGASPAGYPFGGVEDNYTFDTQNPDKITNVITKSFNAIDIDWNDATTTMGGEQKHINTSGDLISYLATAYTNAYDAVTGGSDINLNSVPLSIGDLDGNYLHFGEKDSNIGEDIIIKSNSLEYLRIKDNNIKFFPETAKRDEHGAAIRIMKAQNHGSLESDIVDYTEPMIMMHSLASSRSGTNKMYVGGFYEDTAKINIKRYTGGTTVTQSVSLGRVAHHSTVYITRDGTINAKDIGINLPNENHTTSVSTLLSKINPADYQSGNSGPIIAQDTTTGKLFKSLATVNDTGVFFTSDISLKENVEQIIDSEIDKLFETESGNMYSFDWKDSHEHSFGFIAQELEQFAPEAVHEFDGIKKVNYEVALTKVCAAMFKKIKQLEARIDELEK